MNQQRNLKNDQKIDSSFVLSFLSMTTRSLLINTSKKHQTNKKKVKRIHLNKNLSIDFFLIFNCHRELTRTRTKESRKTSLAIIFHIKYHRSFLISPNWLNHVAHLTSDWERLARAIKAYLIINNATPPHTKHNQVNQTEQQPQLLLKPFSYVVQQFSGCLINTHSEITWNL